MTKEQFDTLEAEYDKSINGLNRVLILYIIEGNSRPKWGQFSNWNIVNTCTTKALEDS